MEKHLLGLFSFPPLSVQALVKTLRLPETCSHIPPPHFTQKGRCGGGEQEGAEQLVKTLNRAKCQQWGGGLGFQGCTS